MGTQIVTDGTQDVDAAVVNLFTNAGGTKTNVSILFAHIRYTGAAWEVVSTTDSAILESGDLAWDTDHLEITLDTYTNTPAAMPGSVAAGGTISNRAQVDPISNTQIDVYFFTSDGTPDTTEGVDMDFMLILIGA